MYCILKPCENNVKFNISVTHAIFIECAMFTVYYVFGFAFIFKTGFFIYLHLHAELPSLSEISVMRDYH